MKKLNLVIVNSSVIAGQLSLRCRDVNENYHTLRNELFLNGFRFGDKVVLISEEEYNELKENNEKL